LFSSGGNQGRVVWLDGEVVTMAGRGSFLAVFYHDQAPLFDGTQKLGYVLLEGKSGCIVSKGPLSCVSSGCTLTWVGFNSDSSLVVMDSDGMVSMLARSGVSPAEDRHAVQWEWVPVLDTMGLRKSADTTFWPVAVQDSKLLCVPIKKNTYPDAFRRPVTSALGLRLPLARSTLPAWYARFVGR
jgi:chromosome transmission fidelity protein 4